MASARVCYDIFMNFATSIYPEQHKPDPKPFFKRIWFWIASVALVIILSLILWVGGHQQGNQSTKDLINNLNSYNNPVACPEELTGLFTNSLMERQDFLSIIPLGSLNPSVHTFPTDHVYYQYRVIESGYVPYERPVLTPGKMTLFALSESRLTKADGSYYGSDSELRFSVCGDVILRLGHLDKLSAEIEALKERTEPVSCEENAEPPGGYHELNISSTRCEYVFDQKVDAGEIVAYVGNMPDSQENALDVFLVNVESDNVYCPLDAYTPQLKTEAYDLLGQYIEDELVAPTREPLCGDVTQEITGTLQGRWYEKTTDPQKIKKDPNARGIPEMLAFAWENVLTDYQSVSLGSDFHEPYKVMFIPVNSGQINRAFSQVQPDGKIYCYQAADEYSIMKGEKEATVNKVIVTLIDDHNLQIEQKEGACTGGETFEDPLYFTR